MGAIPSTSLSFRASTLKAKQRHRRFRPSKKRFAAHRCRIARRVAPYLGLSWSIRWQMAKPARGPHARSDRSCSCPPDVPHRSPAARPASTLSPACCAAMCTKLAAPVSTPHRANREERSARVNPVPSFSLRQLRRLPANFAVGGIDAVVRRRRGSRGHSCGCVCRKKTDDNKRPLQRSIRN